MSPAAAPNEPPIQGELQIHEDFPNCTTAFLSWADEDGTAYRTELFQMNGQDDFLVIHPVNTFRGSKNFFGPKYTQIQAIALEGFGFGSGENEAEAIEILEALPDGLIKNHNYGLGFFGRYKTLVKSIEECSPLVKTLALIRDGETWFDEESEVLNISHNDYIKLLKGFDQIDNRAHYVSLSERKRFISNNLAGAFGREVKIFNGKRDLIRNAIADGVEDWEAPTRTDAAEAMEDALEADTPLSQEEHHTLLRLQDRIELVTFKQLIDQFEEGLTGRNANNEAFWQDLFLQNPFILSQAFGYAVVRLGDQIYMGGKGVTGTGGSITDFLFKNPYTANTAIVEIKTPKTALLGSRYRNGVYTPHNDLSGAVAQVLDQRYHFQKSYTTLKDESFPMEFKSYWVRCCLIIGVTPKDPNLQKSFELFRGNLKDVDLITFDELLEKLKILYTLLHSAGTLEHAAPPEFDEVLTLEDETLQGIPIDFELEP